MLYETLDATEQTLRSIFYSEPMLLALLLVSCICSEYYIQG